MPQLHDDEPRSGETRGQVAEMLDLLGRRLGGAIVLAGAFIAVGIYSSDGGGDEVQTYQAFAADGEVFRVNTDSGTIIACNATRCTRILERGQDLLDEGGNTLFKGPVPTAQPALPAPAAAQQAQPATAAEVAPNAPAPTK